MTSVSFPPSRPDRKLSPFGGTSTGVFGSRPDASKNPFGLNGAGAGGGQRSTRNLNNQPPDMTTPATKRKGVNPFDGASSDDNRRRKNTKGDSQGDWKKKGPKSQGAKPNGAKAPKGFGTTQSRGGFGTQNNNNHSSGSTDYETDDANGELNGDGTAYSDKIFSQLRQDGIAPPKWPSDPGNTSSKAAMAKFREEYKTYRDRARTSLMRAGLIDDPDKPKRLEDAIDFKGICDAMCPDFEKITRITEFDVQSAEKDPRTTFANTSKMVKKLARSAAGQEAPLPMDVRSTAALRRTLDYLIDDLLPIDDKLPSSHGFLWDRTRAIRRDFIFHSTMSPEEMKDQVYCLETIARFHVTALHLLSQEGFAPEDFSEQQEIEQLGKALLSLMFAYDDCKPQGVVCENEAEFRAYHLLFSANTPNILDNVQKEWGDSRFWTESDTIRTAVSLVESLQSAEDFHGPLGSGPSMATSGAHLTYFRILQSREVSYTMACFAEIHLGQLRRSVLRSLKKAYTRPRHGAKDITPSSLNRFLHFDTEDQAIEFVEQHGLSFSNGQGPAGEPIRYLDTSQRMTWPRIHHSFSQRLVERKRGSRSLPEIIHRTIADESTGAGQQAPTGFSTGPASFKPPPQQAPFGSHSTTNADSPFFKLPSSAPQVGTSTGLTGTPSFDKATEGHKPTTSSSPFGNPFSTASSPFTGASSVQQGGSASSSSSTAAPVTNPFAAKTSPFGKPNVAAESATPSSNPFGSLNQPNGTSQPKAPSIPAFPSPAFGTGAQPKAQEQAQPAASTGGSPAITVTPPTPKFPLPTSATAAESSTPFKFPSNTGVQSATPNAPSSPFQPTPKSSATPQLPSFSAGAAAPAQPEKPFTTFQPPPNQPPSLDPTTAAPSILSQTPTSSTASSGQSPLPSFNFQGVSSEAVKPAPSPQQSFPPAVTSPVPTAASPLAQAKPPQAPPVKQRSKQDVMADFAKWFVTGDNGLIQEFEKYMVEQLVSAAFEQHHREEEERKRREEEERDLAEARKFQVYNLSVKYFYRWREIARNLRLTKLRRQEREEYRRAQREQREEEIRQRKKAAKVAEAKKRALERNGFDPVEEFRELLQLRKDGTQADLQAEAEALLATGILSGVSDERVAAANVIRAPATMESPATNTPLPRSRSSTALSQSTTGAKPRGAKTRAIREEFGKSATNFRRSLPPMSAHSSSSRLSSEPQKRVSKVSDRWRLKAMGLVTMPDGTALPETIANEMRYNGKRYAGLGSFGLDSTERRRSVSADLNHAAEARLRFSQSLNGGSGSGSGSAAAVPQVNGISPLSKRKRGLDDDDNEVAVADEAVTRVKKRPSSNVDIDRILREARENLESLRSSRIELDEGADWFREQNEMMHAEEASRASSPWGKSGHR
ncbi:GANP/Nin1/mts3/eIF-3 p25 family protein [Colletotrichum scovillei]|uniref:GANP/Nin1/mts3/eIF-3 p25 family protein n=1 Tax=Colletotrichum scovillei TaxID=1209932 RepID=A0A9P7UKE5_9PEZI|nr:GANP/Nin1/mts3/eIF-3 p25 family protein [Colletotrichum scovillei]KAF4780410.1 GANP/Nin1/mts3/eIF-3 p25 family protein [Colletotrichum scovillei]KAG7057908.1 GANP/Nin1/mts3/eIF-3 p25 family protein [Colletotrichum scovillei]KAG7076453.1 GANP/Nin1/mts3/eIF-3 p25 family protein [Colletotrichum scovillei]KAG7083651.1 GANP/Nin1/mts3/eIF-3 p25 family protein [Colletotrichum scovillei]